MDELKPRLLAIGCGASTGAAIGEFSSGIVHQDPFLLGMAFIFQVLAWVYWGLWQKARAQREAQRVGSGLTEGEGK